MIPLMVVPTLTRHDLLAQMLATVDFPVGHMVVVDNSGRGIVGGSGPWERFTVLPMPVNLGVAASWNLAIKFGFRHDYVLICSDDMLWPEGALARFAELSAEDRLVVSSSWPHFQAFSVGAQVVSKVGLFDEGFYPAYFEDMDFLRRCEAAGIDKVDGPETLHRNSSTLKSRDEFKRANDRSWQANRDLFESGAPGGFNPFRWRANAWM